MCCVWLVLLFDVHFSRTPQPLQIHSTIIVLVYAIVHPIIMHGCRVLALPLVRYNNRRAN